ncbi:trypsin-like peptidase domain-containing protein [Streptomyces tsukubensis]|uniref:trypsin-like peptidase domain-containing protein n=1 Tax=Streptomyces tsukubensis TaxID=83656 RepID=UPI00117DED0A|nr:trypsin-like peptidase domain-containing protein [Streptomyces tsukubensis]QFR95586.1 PDZ domain-containing protein [Streptomyces tsukubensis]
MSGPVVSEPVVSGPVEVEPVVPGPLVSEPVVSEPVEAEPVVVETAVLEPTVGTASGVAATDATAPEAPEAPEGRNGAAQAVPGQEGGRVSPPGPGAAERPVRPSSEPELIAPTPGAPESRPGSYGRPLHDPDPYGTPPYGEPGPWAPAPPVQHPATTPPHGVPTPTAQNLPQDSQAPPQGATPHVASAFAETSHGLREPSAPHGSGYPGQPSSGRAATHAVPAPHAVPADEAYPGGQGPGPTGPLPAAGAPPEEPPAGPWQNYDPWAAPEPDEPAPPRRRVRTLLFGGLVLALVAGGIGGVLGSRLEREGGLGGIVLPQAAPATPERPAGSVADIAARALPSVVTLHVRGASEQDTGTGFVLDDQGHILTNNHVVQPAGADGDIEVTFSGGQKVKARTVGRDSGYDLAVVRVSGVKGLTPLTLGDSNGVRVGDPVVAIGAPYDLANTVTSGIISAKDRPITAGGESGGDGISYVDALQTDASINPGNSGGPLVDTAGHAIGINSAIRSAGDSSKDPEKGQSGSIGLGFAIPVNLAKRVAEELMDTGHATHPVIGVTLDMNYGGQGAKVAKGGNDGGPAVSEDGPGAKAGLRDGDVITGIDGEPVNTGEELIVKIRSQDPGARLELTVRRGGDERRVSLVLDSASGD